MPEKITFYIILTGLSDELCVLAHEEKAEFFLGVELINVTLNESWETP
jgi:hypothetical protein